MNRYPGLDEQGHLTAAGTVRLLAQTMMFRAKVGRRRARLEVEALPCPAPPTSTLAKRAEQWSVESSPAWLHAHNQRVFGFGALVGQVEAVGHDAELLYVGALLHDLGLTQLYAPSPGECFGLAGARAARKLLEADGVPGEWVNRVCDAIALHLEVTVPLERGAEAKLLHAGALLDVLGEGRSRLHRSSVEAVFAEWPRSSFSERIAGKLREVKDAAPKSRLAFYCRHGFAERAERAWT